MNNNNNTNISERLLSAKNFDVVDQKLEDTIRPKKLSSFIGQDNLKKNLGVFISAAKLRNESLDHVLFYGPPGLGKTTISQIIANEMGSSIKYISGPSITKQGDLAAIITSLEEKDILFIDEIHRLPIQVEEILYSAMEDYKIDFMVGEGATARSIRVDLPKFTLVGATTRYGMLSSPLRDRFGILLQLNFYNPNDLVHIILRSAKILNVEITEEAAFEIAKSSRGTPRISNKLLRRLRDFLTISKSEILDIHLTKNALNNLGVDDSGLDDLDRRYLKAIYEFYNGGPVGIDTLVAVLSESKDTLEEAVEPYLLQQGYIAKTQRGRVITDIAKNYLYSSKFIKFKETEEM